MAFYPYNPTFKRPTTVYRQRSPSPPTFEPLSPPRPRPIEPSFNYPALANVDFSIHAAQTYAAPPTPRAPSTSYKNVHHRTPSIDTLAEAALALSPGYAAHSRIDSGTQQYGQSTSYSNRQYASYGASEPPHKRSRSELLPSPQVGAYASRPATSYETHGLSQGTYDSRVEEAALLLNFRTGGWPSNGGAMSPPQLPASAAPRPHANSFPRDGAVGRPTQVGQRTSLLPPFHPSMVHQARPALPTPEHGLEERLPAPQRPRAATYENDVVMADAGVFYYHHGKLSAQQTQTPPDEAVSRAQSVEPTPSEASSASRTRRGWPKGKPRGTGARKTIAEKVVSKRAAAARKKKPEAKKAEKKSNGRASAAPSIVVETAAAPRRKSLSDMTAPQDDESMRSTRAQSVPASNPMLVREVSPVKGAKRQAKVTADTVCAGCTTSRESATANSEMDEWISCNGCKKWYHIDCAGFKKAHEIKDVDKFFCTACEPTYGKTTWVRKSKRAHASVDYAELQRGVLKTSEDSNEHHYIQPIKDGTFQFDPEMFPRMRPEMVTKEFFERSGTFVEPICIPAALNPRPWKEKGDGFDSMGGEQMDLDEEPDSVEVLTRDFEYDTVPDLGQDKLGMVMPEGLTVRQVCNMVGPDYPLDVIDVKTQNSGQKWNLKRWADYYEQDGDDKPIRNVISLEVSQTKLGRLLRRPQIVRDIDLQDSVWPQEEKDKGKWPKVQYYCLMSVADSYTDFHVDFGGSSVYYHILKGKKTFFFIPPKPKHLKAYEEWNESPQQNYTFLPHITKECYRVDLHEGDTMLIPSGWIHAVWTPETSLVIGGNFLTRMSFKNQFKLVEIEKANHTPIKFRYPFFQRIMWYTVLQYLSEDPLPTEVNELLNAGKKFERDIPIWQDWDGELAAKDPRPGAHNARYYSQAELDGLPDLMTYIWKTVMMVLGRVEGVSEDQKKRVNASIPKGYGEPLEIARNFAKWVSWKCSADPPAWAHLDFALSAIKEEGPPKKLSQRALKGLERKEAIAAWRIAPDRQSERVMSKHAGVAVANGASDANQQDSQEPTPQHNGTPGPSDIHQKPLLPGPQYTPSTAAPSILMMSPLPAGAHFSTPKTSVLGPKRVACDACRKRRIRCKHKDEVLTATPEMLGQFPGMQTFQSADGSEMHDSITLAKDGQYAFSTNGDGGEGQHGSMGIWHVDGSAVPAMGTNSYLNATIPMALNGVSIFGETPKKGRSKACLECRRSKRRCIHDDDGRVDPIKAAEQPIPRGAQKKRSSDGESSPIEPKKAKSEAPVAPTPPPVAQAGGQAGILLPPQRVTVTPPAPSRTPSIHVQGPEDDLPQDGQQQPPEIDPSLYSAYQDPQDSNGPYAEPSTYPPTSNGNFNDHNSYPPTSDAPFMDHTMYPPTTNGQFTEQNYAYFSGPEHQPNMVATDYPSLEQIASEVLDMNGQADAPPQEEEQGDYIDRQLNAPSYERLRQAQQANPNSNGGAPKTDESVDSAISLPSTESLQQKHQHQQYKNKVMMHGSPEDRKRSIDDRLMEAFAADNSRNANAETLPLYQPPAPPMSLSPEAKRSRKGSVGMRMRRGSGVRA